MAETRGTPELLPRPLCLLQAAGQLATQMPADAVLLLTETELDWAGVRSLLDGCRLLVAAQDPQLTDRLKQEAGLAVLDIDAKSVTVRERISQALLEAIATEQLR